MRRWSTPASLEICRKVSSPGGVSLKPSRTAAIRPFWPTATAGDGRPCERRRLDADLVTAFPRNCFCKTASRFLRSDDLYSGCRPFQNGQLTYSYFSEYRIFKATAGACAHTLRPRVKALAVGRTRAVLR